MMVILLSVVVALIYVIPAAILVVWLGWPTWLIGLVALAAFGGTWLVVKFFQQADRPWM